MATAVVVQKWHLALDLRWQLQLSNHGNCSCLTWQLQLNKHGRGSGPCQLQGRVVTITRGVRDREVGGWTYGRVGVIYFAHMQACERDRQKKKGMAKNMFG